VKSSEAVGKLATVMHLGTVQFGGRGDDQVRDRAPVTIAAMLGKQHAQPRLPSRHALRSASSDRSVPVSSRSSSMRAAAR
jgi:hypothetical protein